MSAGGGTLPASNPFFVGAPSLSLPVPSSSGGLLAPLPSVSPFEKLRREQKGPKAEENRVRIDALEESPLRKLLQEITSHMGGVTENTNEEKKLWANAFIASLSGDSGTLLNLLNAYLIENNRSVDTLHDCGDIDRLITSGALDDIILLMCPELGYLKSPELSLSEALKRDSKFREDFKKNDQVAFNRARSFNDALHSIVAAKLEEVKRNISQGGIIRNYEEKLQELRPLLASAPPTPASKASITYETKRNKELLEILEKLLQRYQVNPPLKTLLGNYLPPLLVDGALDVMRPYPIGLVLPERLRAAIKRGGDEALLLALFPPHHTKLLGNNNERVAPSKMEEGAGGFLQALFKLGTSVAFDANEAFKYLQKQLILKKDINIFVDMGLGPIDFGRLCITIASVLDSANTVFGPLGKLPPKFYAAGERFDHPKYKKRHVLSDTLFTSRLCENNDIIFEMAYVSGIFSETTQQVGVHLLFKNARNGEILFEIIYDMEPGETSGQSLSGLMTMILSFGSLDTEPVGGVSAAGARAPESDSNKFDRERIEIATTFAEGSSIRGFLNNGLGNLQSLFKNSAKNREGKSTVMNLLVREKDGSSIGLLDAFKERGAVQSNLRLSRELCDKLAVALAKDIKGVQDPSQFRIIKSLIEAKELSDCDSCFVTGDLQCYNAAKVADITAIFYTRVGGAYVVSEIYISSKCRTGEDKIEPAEITRIVTNLLRAAPSRVARSGVSESKESGGETVFLSAEGRGGNSSASSSSASSSTGEDTPIPPSSKKSSTSSVKESSKSHILLTEGDKAGILRKRLTSNPSAKLSEDEEFSSVGVTQSIPSSRRRKTSTAPEGKHSEEQETSYLEKYANNTKGKKKTAKVDIAEEHGVGVASAAHTMNEDAPQSSSSQKKLSNNQGIATNILNKVKGRNQSQSSSASVTISSVTTSSIPSIIEPLEDAVSAVFTYSPSISTRGGFRRTKKQNKRALRITQRGGYLDRLSVLKQGKISTTYKKQLSESNYLLHNTDDTDIEHDRQFILKILMDIIRSEVGVYVVESFSQPLMIIRELLIAIENDDFTYFLYLVKEACFHLDIEAPNTLLSFLYDAPPESLQFSSASSLLQGVTTSPLAEAPTTTSSTLPPPFSLASSLFKSQGQSKLASSSSAASTSSFSSATSSPPSSVFASISPQSSQISARPSPKQFFTDATFEDDLSNILSQLLTKSKIAGEILHEYMDNVEEKFINSEQQILDCLKYGPNIIELLDSSGKIDITNAIRIAFAHVKEDSMRVLYFYPSPLHFYDYLFQTETYREGLSVLPTVVAPAIFGSIDSGTISSRFPPINSRTIGSGGGNSASSGGAASSSGFGSLGFGSLGPDDSDDDYDEDNDATGGSAPLRLPSKYNLGTLGSVSSIPPSVFKHIGSTEGSSTSLEEDRPGTPVRINRKRVRRDDESREAEAGSVEQEFGGAKAAQRQQFPQGLGGAKAAQRQQFPQEFGGAKAAQRQKFPQGLGGVFSKQEFRVGRPSTNVRPEIGGRSKSSGSSLSAARDAAIARTSLSAGAEEGDINAESGFNAGGGARRKTRRSRDKIRHHSTRRYRKRKD